MTEGKQAGQDIEDLRTRAGRHLGENNEELRKAWVSVTTREKNTTAFTALQRFVAREGKSTPRKRSLEFIEKACTELESQQAGAKGSGTGRSAAVASFLKDLVLVVSRVLRRENSSGAAPRLDMFEQPFLQLVQRWVAGAGPDPFVFRHSGTAPSFLDRIADGVLDTLIGDMITAEKWIFYQTETLGSEFKDRASILLEVAKLALKAEVRKSSSPHKSRWMFRFSLGSPRAPKTPRPSPRVALAIAGGVGGRISFDMYGQATPEQFELLDVKHTTTNALSQMADEASQPIAIYYSQTAMEAFWNSYSRLELHRHNRRFLVQRFLGSSTRTINDFGLGGAVDEYLIARGITDRQERDRILQSRLAQVFATKTALEKHREYYQLFAKEDLDAWVSNGTRYDRPARLDSPAERRARLTHVRNLMQSFPNGYRLAFIDMASLSLAPDVSDVDVSWTVSGAGDDPFAIVQIALMPKDTAEGEEAWIILKDPDVVMHLEAISGEAWQKQATEPAASLRQIDEWLSTLPE